MLLAAGLAGSACSGDAGLPYDGPRTVAVLPFASDDGQPSAGPGSREGGMDIFARGLQADLIDLLSRIDGVTVISQGSVASLTEDRREGAGSSGVGAFVGLVLDGRVERGSDRLRVDAHLRAAAGDTIWSDSFDRGLTLDNVFRIQAEIAQQVARALRVALAPEAVAQMGRSRTNSLAAYDRYLEGRAHYARRFQSGAALQAVTAFLEAQAIDSTFAAAHAAEAEARIWLYWGGGDAGQAALARAALDRAVALNPQAVETELALGTYRYRVERDFAGARLLLESLLPRAPGNADLHSMLGGIARREGRWDDAVARFRRAAELDPARVGGAVTMAQTLRYLRRADESLEWAERAVALDPTDTRARAERTWTLIGLKGDTVAARLGLTRLTPEEHTRSRARVVLLSPPADPAYYRRDFPSALALWTSTASTLRLMMVSWASGDREGARRYARGVRDDWLRAPTPDSEETNIRASAMLYAAMAHVMLGERDAGLALADEAEALSPVSEDAFAGPRIAWMRTLVALADGDHDDAFRRLEALLDIPSELGPGQLRLNPWFDPLRGDPRFAALLRRADEGTR